MKNYPKISIITPSYNQGKFIEQTILSIINQGYPNTEHIIIDGGSTDNTIDIIKKYQRHISYWVSEPDEGQSDAMNKGLQRATGDIVGFVSTDDLVVSGVFFRIADMFSQLPEQVGVIHGAAVIFNQDGLEKIVRGHEKNNAEKYLSSIAFPFAASYIRKKYIDAVGNFNKELHYGMDYDLFARLALVCDFHRINLVLEKYRLHAESKSIKMEKLFVEDWIRVFISVVSNIRATWILDELKKLNVFEEYLDFENKYSFSFTPKALDYQQMLYSFLVEVFCADYRNGSFHRAKVINQYLKKNYFSLLKKETEVKTMSSRLDKYPVFLIKKYRKFKQWIPVGTRAVSEKKEIGFILSHINKSLQWQWYSEELIKRNISHFFILIDKHDSMFVRDVHEQGTVIYFLRHKNFFSYFINLFRIIKILLKEKPRIVHTGLPFGNLLGQMAALILGIKKRVTTCENASWPHDFKSWKQEVIDKFTYRAAKKIISTCEVANEYLVEKWKINPAKLTLINQGLRFEDFENITAERIEKARKELHIDKNHFVLGMIARFEYWKGHIYVIEAIRKIIAQNPDVRLLIFGSGGSEFETIMKKIKEYNLSDYVIYKGFFGDSLVLYKLFDIHIHVPINKYVETFGINIIEGMAAQCTQILTKSGIAYSSARHLENSWVVDYKSSDDIARAILELKTNKELRRKLAYQAYLDAKKYYDVGSKAEKHLELYRQL